jgi:MFS family permease
MDEDSSATPVPAVEPGAPPAKWWTIQSPGTILVVLALINFLNYVDRMVLSPLVPFLKDPVEKGGLGLSSSQAGLLQTAFMVVHSLASIPLGIVADRYLRTRVIAIGVGLWSLATAAAGFARSFAQIFVMRAAVGIGEATYAPAASALISERFSRAARARALGVFQLGMVFGGAVGLIAGGVVAATWSWRAAFFVVGAPGLMLTALVLCIREPRRARGKAVRPATGPRPSGSAAFAVTTPEGMSAALWINVAGILITFFTGAIMFWAPQFILDARYGGDKAFLKIVSMQFGTIAVVAGIAGVMAGAFVADRLERSLRGGRVPGARAGHPVRGPRAGRVLQRLVRGADPGRAARRRAGPPARHRDRDLPVPGARPG